MQSKEAQNAWLEAARMAWQEHERLIADSKDATGDREAGLIWAGDAMKEFCLRLRERAGQ